MKSFILLLATVIFVVTGICVIIDVLNKTFDIDSNAQLSSAKYHTLLGVNFVCILVVMFGFHL